MRGAPPPAGALDPTTLKPFVDALPIPVIAKASGTRTVDSAGAKPLPYYRVEMRAFEAKLHRDLGPAELWGYDGAFPGPTFDTQSGEGFLVDWANNLPKTHLLPLDRNLHGAEDLFPDVRTVVHAHGAKAPPESDGYPEDWTTPGHSSLFHYPNRQEAATLWYHDHAMGIERLNQYAGLLGVYLLRDAAEDALELPRAPYELPLILCDRLFGQDGQLRYSTSGAPDAPWIQEIYCDAHLVNGKLFPYLDVEPRRYRFRVVNASNSRFYDLSLSNGGSFHQIGTDQGLLPAPVPLTRLTLAPAERADLLVDFSAVAGQRILLKSQSFELMQFRIGAASAQRSTPLPAKLRPVRKIPESAAVNTRTLTLNEYHDPQTHRMLMLLDGKHWHEPVTEKPELDSVEIWRFMNLTEDSHPIHLHLVRFQILDRSEELV